MRQAVRSGERAMRAVRVTEQEDPFADVLDQRDQVVDLVFEMMVVCRIRLAPAAPGDGIDSELLAKARFHEFPVGVVIAERAVRQHERRAAAALVVRDGYPSWGFEAFHA